MIVAMVCTAQTDPQQQRRPNIIFILIDDLRWDDLGAAGHLFVKTTNIDRLGSEGALFRNAFITAPLCSPSRASFLAGQYAHTHGIPAGSPVHNTYIKRNDDKTFNVWLFPAFQTNNVAVYGGEFVYTIDGTAEKIKKDESYFQGTFRGFNAKPPREIWLNYSEKEKPTLGSIFFVWYYKEYFTNIYINNAKSTSSVIKQGGEYVWVAPRCQRIARSFGGNACASVSIRLDLN